MPTTYTDSSAELSEHQQTVQQWLKEAVSDLGGSSRPGQETMASEVTAALDEQRHLLVQAGTGTGKSLAYLIPALHHALESERPVVISTATLALQAQIMKRDVPRLLDALKEELPRPAKAALVKGRSNYLCKNKLAGGFPDDDGQEAMLGLLDDGAAVPLTEMTPNSKASFGGTLSDLGQQIQKLRAWADETETGDKDDLGPGIQERAWRQVSVHARECLGSKCPLFEECFAEIARHKANEADIVVTNHAMLAFSAIEGYGVLPEHDVVIVDEAHELQDRITGSVTAEISGSALKAAATSVRKHTSVAAGSLEEASREFENAFATSSDGLLETGLNQAQENALEAVRNACRTLLSDTKEGGKDQDAGRQIARSRLQAIYDAVERILNSAHGLTGSEARQTGPAFEALWLNRPSTFIPGKGHQPADPMTPPTLRVAPISVAAPLRERLFSEKTVVMTSATLTIGGDFNAVASSVGLSKENQSQWKGLDVGSPFDYPRQGILYAAAHLSPPDRQPSEDMLDELVELVQASGGGVLGLFSSRSAAEDAAEYVRSQIDVNLMCQGESAMATLIREFSEDKDSCLFGTMGLWQGVDVPGDALRLVTIDRIPFPRPDDPMTKARTMRVARNGGNGFLAVSANRAAMRLAQGVGRLIRTQDDRGVVAILDSRMVRKQYGGYIKSALPNFWATTDKNKVLAVLERLNEESS